jgi:hypothetical protein
MNPFDEIIGLLTLIALANVAQLIIAAVKK